MIPKNKNENASPGKKSRGKHEMFVELLIFKNLSHVITVLGAAVVLLFSVFFGYHAGNKNAQSAFIASQAQEISRGVNYFYNDFGRFPSTQEFSDPKIMATYFTIFPPLQFSSGPCSSSFIYNQRSPKAYQLNVCSPTNLGNLRTGWNQITENKP